MDRTLPTFNEAQDRVKIGHFTKQGYDISGIVHVGANDGYEIEYYLKMGIDRILAFEPLPSARKIMFDKYRDNPFVSICDWALGNIDGEAQFHVTDGDGKGSSLLYEKAQIGTRPPSIRVAVHRWDTLVGLGRILTRRLNCCVIDVQGMELEVLRGMDDHIQQFDFLSVECSKVAIYKGESTVHEVVTYLSNHGFVCQTFPFPDHDDVMFVNNRVLHPPEPEKPIPQGTKLNIGSGQRRFDNTQGWVNIDIVSKPGMVPDLLCDVGKDPLPYESDSMDFVVLHHLYEHIGCGEGHGLIREAHRVLKPGGRLIVCVPDMWKIALKWISGEFNEYIFMVNTYGAYQGEPGDRHRWGYSASSLITDLHRAAPWSRVEFFDWRTIPGADIARDDRWILGMEAVK